jgi:hypothetical protein
MELCSICILRVNIRTLDGSPNCGGRYAFAITFRVLLIMKNFRKSWTQGMCYLIHGLCCPYPPHLLSGMTIVHIVSRFLPHEYSLCKALLFYFFTILSFTLRPTNSTSEDHEMPFTLAIILQATITTSTLSDLICFVSIWNTLKGHKMKYNTIEGENV